MLGRFRDTVSGHVSGPRRSLNISVIPETGSPRLASLFIATRFSAFYSHHHLELHEDVDFWKINKLNSRNSTSATLVRLVGILSFEVVSFG